MGIPEIVHLIPYDGIGGVETAARSVGYADDDEFRFSIRYIYSTADVTGGKTSHDPMQIVRAARRIASSGADILVVSLWRSAIVGLLAKIIRPRLKLVTLLHSARDAHLIDFFVTRLAIVFSFEVWGDSKATLAQRSDLIRRKRSRAISFLTRHFPVVSNASPQPSFVFWGRLGPVKNLARAIDIFAAVRQTHPSAHFLIAGPDCGVLPNLRAKCESLGLGDSVRFFGPVAQEEIVSIAQQASFYLQTSDHEGMAMSVMEAMQLGLVPVVTPVGEIASYCREGFDAVIVDDDLMAVESVLALLRSDDTYRRLRANAIAAWQGHPLHRESLLDACRALCRRVS